MAGYKVKNQISISIEIVLIIALIMNISVNIMRTIENRIMLNETKVLLEEVKELKFYD
ncbi:MAG: hypothetical protein RSA29_10460 [Clostridium sp.]|uniref:hypothetical protein n=1 Tax=Clostridium sp. TaxID=1506 RepID=UPI003217C731